MFSAIAAAVICFSVLSGAVYGDDDNTTYILHNTQEFIDFGKKVNAGTDFYGTTVYLESDLDFSGSLSTEFTPIGVLQHMFIGTFDGQGHTVRNLQMKSTNTYVGLFGMLAQGAVVKNIVMDSSNTITNVCEDAYISTVGSIIGACSTYSIACKLMNSINMANVTFDGSVTDSAYLGGLIGYAKPVSALFTMRNCVNYGAVSYIGTSEYRTLIGGLIGECWQHESNPLRCNIKNNMNYGALTHAGTTSGYLFFGGLAGGCNYENKMYNNVNAGSITTKKTIFIGSLVGEVTGESNITNCYYSAESKFDAFGIDLGKAGFAEIWNYDVNLVLGNPNRTIVTDALTNWAEKTTAAKVGKFANWVLNRKGYTLQFVLNGMPYVKYSSQIILLPEPEVEDFGGWFADPSMKTPFNYKAELQANTKVFAKVKTI